MITAEVAPASPCGSLSPYAGVLHVGHDWNAPTPKQTLVPYFRHRQLASVCSGWRYFMYISCTSDEALSWCLDSSPQQPNQRLAYLGPLLLTTLASCVKVKAESESRERFSPLSSVDISPRTAVPAALDARKTPNGHIPVSRLRPLDIIHPKRELKRGCPVNDVVDDVVQIPLYRELSTSFSATRFPPLLAHLPSFSLIPHPTQLLPSSLTFISSSLSTAETDQSRRHSYKASLAASHALPKTAL